MKKEKRRIVMVTAGVFLFLSIVYALTMNNALRRDRDHAVRQAELNAQVYSAELKNDFDMGISATEILEEVLINTGGHLSDFPELARKHMRSYIGSIQLAPDGVVTDIFPMEGNEGGLIDLLHDPDRGPAAQYAVEHDVVAMQGPFALKQGGMGIAVRNPVFLTDENGERHFWGFTIVIIKAQELFQFSFESLESFGYDYRLSATTSPVNQEQKVVLASSEYLDRPAETTFQKGECTWTLEVAPKYGWTVSRESAAISIIGAVLVLLLTASVAGLQVTVAQRKRMKLLSETDPLTGLSNRKVLVERVDAFLADSPNSAATEVFLDIDDFKIINDLYGHDIGDEALKNLSRNLVRAFGPKAVVSRTGGDEFGVFLPGMSAEQAEGLIRNASAMDQTFTTAQGKTYTYTISMGYADYPVQGKTREELSRNVDSALYNVKLNGKHGCQRYVPGMVKQSREQLGFSQKDLLKSLPGAGFICHAKDTCILYANDDLIRLLECGDLEDFNRSYQGMVRNIICSSDFERVMRERNEKLEKVPEGGCIQCRFRIVTKTGRLRSMLAEARFRHNEVFGDLFFVTALELEGD